MPPVIEIKNLSKRYDINRQQGGYIVLREVIANAFRHPLHFIKKKVSETFKNKEDFWALRDINLTVNKGEIVGIIGANGTGKSTLLKILSRITPPTTGEARIRGRVASLLEIGTGFHPELTGRENIFLNGAILGMRKKEVAQKFDAIVEFSGVKKFIDTPVKKYSSGMYVRLAFAVAAHMEPDILLVDEVLAVGDVEFQRKCLGKMDEVTRTAGRTILFVSHNMNAIQKLCNRTVLLENGQIAMAGNTKTVIARYLNGTSKSSAEQSYLPNPKNKVQILNIRLLNQADLADTNIDINKPFTIEIEWVTHEDINEDNAVELIIKDLNDNPLLQIYDLDTNPHFHKNRPAGHYHCKFQFPGGIFNEQPCKLQVYVGSVESEGLWDRKENIDIHFFNSGNFVSSFFGGKRSGGFLFQIPCAVTRQDV